MQLQALNCPNCAAPLQVEANQSLTICLYCNASVRITYPAVTRTLPRVATVALLVPGLFILLIYGRAFFASLRYVRAQTAPAAVLRAAPIGQINTRAGTVHTFRLLLEVRPANTPPFQAQMNLPVRASSLAKLHENTIIEVRYLPNNPNAVIFNKVVSH